jgi:hypothetical protein
MRAGVVIWLLALGCEFRSGVVGTDGGKPGSDGSGSSGVAYREAITIQGVMIAGSETDFPVWISLSGSNASDLATRARSDGGDIFFTDGTNPLDYELQDWNPSQPALQAWVRVPSLARSVNTTIYVEYGDLAKASQPNAARVFRSSYVAVWHLEDSLVTSAVVDAVGMSPGTAVVLDSAASQPGELGHGIAFDGTGNSMITFTNAVSGDTPSVITAWVQQANTAHTSAVAVLGTGATDQSRFLYGVAGAADMTGNGSNVAIGQYADDFYPGGPDIQSSSAWTYLAWHYAGNKVNHVFVNGAEIPGSPNNSHARANTTGTTGYLGYAPEGTAAGQYGVFTGFSGVLDEVRIATSSMLVRDAQWFQIEYANQSSPDTFYTVGAPQLAP